MLLPKELAGRYQAVPVRFVGDDLLLVAVADPTDVGRADDLRLALGHNVRLAVSEPADLERTIKKLYRTQIEVVETEAEAPELTFDPIAQREDIAESSDDTPAVKLVHATLAQAIEDGASDIHFEPQEDDMIVRARIDGVTRPVALIPKQMQLGVISRLKIMGNLDIAERRAPQDGRVSIRFHGNPLDLRIAIMPTTYGEQVVLRIMHRAVSKPDLGELGMTDAAREHFETRDPAAVRRGRRVRPDRLRQDDDALHGAAPAQRPGARGDDDRGPGRVPDPRDQPDRDLPEERPHLRARAAHDPALRSRRAARRRDPRRGDGRGSRCRPA